MRKIALTFAALVAFTMIITSCGNSQQPVNRPPGGGVIDTVPIVDDKPNHDTIVVVPTTTTVTDKK